MIPVQTGASQVGFYKKKYHLIYERIDLNFKADKLIRCISVHRLYSSFLAVRFILDLLIKSARATPFPTTFIIFKSLYLN